MNDAWSGAGGSQGSSNNLNLAMCAFPGWVCYGFWIGIFGFEHKGEAHWKDQEGPIAPMPVKLGHG